MGKIDLDIVRPEDYSATALFLEQQKAGGLTQGQWQEKFLDLWERNPFFKAGVHARGWLLRDADGVVCGFLGSFPILYARHGRHETAFVMTTWFVRQDARSRSLALFGCFMKQKGVLLNTSSLVEMERLLRHFKFTPLASEWIGRDHVLPVKSRPLARHLQARSNGRWPLSGIVLATTVAVGLVSMMAALCRGCRESAIVVREAGAPPVDTEQWWEKFRKLHAFTLVRDQVALGYFFFTGGLVKNCKLFEVRRDEELLGFVAVRLILREGYSYFELIDVALLEDDAGVYSAVFYALRTLEYGWRPDVAFIKANAFTSPMRRGLVSSGFWGMVGRGRFHFFDHSEEIVPEVFYSTLLDGDRVCF